MGFPALISKRLRMENAIQDTNEQYRTETGQLLQTEQQGTEMMDTGITDNKNTYNCLQKNDTINIITL